MGNNEMKEAKANFGEKKRSELDLQLMKTFQVLADADDSDSSLDEESFKKIFDQQLARLVVQYFSEGGQRKIDKERFVAKSTPFFTGSPEFYCTFLVGDKQKLEPSDVKDAIKLCCECSGIQLVGKDDELFLQALVDDLMKGTPNSCTLNDFKLWVQANSPRLTSDLQQIIQFSLKNGERKNVQSDLAKTSSNLLTDFQLSFVRGFIPISYFANTDHSKCPWSLLYSSENDGLSSNRFETKVFNYRSPTLSFFKMGDGKLFVIGVDEEWRQSTANFGGINSFVCQVLPEFIRIDEGNGLILYNTKNRTIPMGISIGKKQKPTSLKIDSDFSSVSDIEVWGCGNEEISNLQMQQKKWEQKQSEKHAKVPLPGNWDENPDRSLLEMAGVKVSHAEK